MRDQKTCRDINECLANTHECAETCINDPPGAYHCDCDRGYELAEDGHRCVDIDEVRVLGVNKKLDYLFNLTMCPVSQSLDLARKMTFWVILGYFELIFGHFGPILDFFCTAYIYCCKADS